jgi:L-ascorbate metabolism protein UlaG (beta-lactamase superfamily)
MKKQTVFGLFLFICISTQLVKGQQVDFLETNSGKIGIYPILHGSLVITYKDLTLFIDPYGGPERYLNFKDPDIILITDIHGDHLHPNTLAGLTTDKTIFITPQSVFDKLGDQDKLKSAVLQNGQAIHRKGIFIQATPMYNLPETEESRHPKGRGNGYLLSIDNKQIYISGDTEDIVEMRMLKNIDVAFVCMNLPYTMDIYQAANAVLEFEPAIVYPYHYRGSDVTTFKDLIHQENKSIEVRLRDWYTDN